VLRVKLDMEALYERDAAEAAQQLRVALEELPEHEFTVRPALPPPIRPSVSPPPQPCERDAKFGSESSYVDRYPKLNKSRNHRV